MSGYRLAPLQLAHWRRLQAEPRFPWASSLTLGVHGALEAERLRAALAVLVQRHEILRTRFVCPAAGAAPEMTVERQGDASLELHDWRALGLVERERECRRLERALRASYPLDGAAVLRLAVARTGPEEHVLILAQSILAADWRSLWSLARELVAELAGQAPEEPAQVADLAQWLSDVLEGEDAPAGRAAWQELDLRSAAELRTSLESDRGARPFELQEVSRELTPALDEALASVARAKHLPREALLSAAWQAWLARLAERQSLVLGVRSAGRAFQGLDHALGTFERALPIQVQLDERTSLAQLARRGDEQLARGTEWHEFFQPEQAHPDFAFRYAFEHLPGEPSFALGGLALELLRRDGFGEPCTALLRVEETARGCELRLAHQPRFLEAAEASALLDGFLGLLENALARPDAPLATLSAVNDAQRAQLLALARGPELSAAPRRLDEWILETARAHPTACAVSAAGGTLRYQELEQRSGALAAELQALGLGPGAFVGVHLERSPELVVALLAVLRAGAAYVPLPPNYPRERVLAMLADSRARAVVGSERSAEALSGFRGPVVVARAARPNAAPRAGGTAADLAYVIYTSGSTGKPKGVPITHANLAFSTRARAAHYAERVERYLLLSSFAFDSSVAGIFWTLTQGGTLVLPPEGYEKDLTLLPGLVARERPTHVLGLPSLWSLVLEQAKDGELDSLTTVIVAGESCPPELVRRHAARLPHARLHNEYGPTEGTVWSTVFDTREPCARASVPIGRPIPGAANYVLTPERELAALGVAGELWIGGPGVAAGYLERPELTGERFADDPFGGGRMYRTGDRARMLPDGNLEFLGRLDQQVKVRGYRIEPGEIESVLAGHPAVREALVVAREGAGGATLVAYVVPIGPRPTETDLVRYLGERLPEHMVPARAVCLERWPLLPNGKLDRRALPAPEESAFVEPEGALEIVLAALFADVLGLEQVGRHDDFFALGGHSLSATRLYARLKETLQIGSSLRVLFEQRTPAALAAALRAAPQDGARVERLAEVVLAVLESGDESQAVGA